MTSNTLSGLRYAGSADSRPGLWRRFFDALIESRMQAAEREIARHREAIDGYISREADDRPLSIGPARRLPQ